MNFGVGQLVLIKDDRYPPSQWPLGRIIEVYPGPDGIVRVVTIKTATTCLRQHEAHLYPLQLDDKVKCLVGHLMVFSSGLISPLDEGRQNVRVISRRR